jgi:hypothetical protein
VGSHWQVLLAKGTPVLLMTPVQETHLRLDEMNEFGSGHSHFKVYALKTKLVIQVHVLVLALKAPVLFLFLKVLHAKHRSLAKIELDGH